MLAVSVFRKELSLRIRFKNPGTYIPYTTNWLNQHRKMVCFNLRDTTVLNRRVSEAKVSSVSLCTPQLYWDRQGSREKCRFAAQTLAICEDLLINIFKLPTSLTNARVLTSLQKKNHWRLLPLGQRS